MKIYWFLWEFNNKITKYFLILVEVDKHMIDYVLNNLDISNNDKIFIIYNSKLDNFDFCRYINNKYPNIYLIKIKYQY